MSKEEKDSDKINKEIFEEIKLQETPSLKTKLISVYKISDERRQISEDKYIPLMERNPFLKFCATAVYK